MKKISCLFCLFLLSGIVISQSRGQDKAIQPHTSLLIEGIGIVYNLNETGDTKLTKLLKSMAKEYKLTHDQIQNRQAAVVKITHDTNQINGNTICNTNILPISDATSLKGGVLPPTKLYFNINNPNHFIIVKGILKAKKKEHLYDLQIAPKK